MESLFIYLFYCYYTYTPVKRGAANCASVNPHIHWQSGLCCLIFGHIKHRDFSRTIHWAHLSCFGVSRSSRRNLAGATEGMLECSCGGKHVTSSQDLLTTAQGCLFLLRSLSTVTFSTTCAALEADCRACLQVGVPGRDKIPISAVKFGVEQRDLDYTVMVCRGQWEHCACKYWDIIAVGPHIL